MVVDNLGRLVAGHARCEAASLSGLTHIPAIRLSNLSPAELRAYALADNKLAEKAGWDRSLLAIEIQQLSKELPAIGLDISITGFEAVEIDGLLGDFVNRKPDPADQLPEICKEPVSRRGDLWQLGRHRLLCGDARAAADLRKLMGRETAALVITQLPYNDPAPPIEKKEEIKDRQSVAACRKLFSRQLIQFLIQAFSLAAGHSARSSFHLVFVDWGHLREVLIAGEEVYSELKDLILWSKTDAAHGTFYCSQHDLACVFKNGSASHIHKCYPSRAGALDELSRRPTVKPLALVGDALRHYSQRGDLVLDPFVGSGTSILAAERVGRRGYGLELDPRYVDVAIRRWQAFTKRDAVLAGTNETFDKVAAARPTKKGGKRK